MEKTVKFEQYQAIKAHALELCGQGKELEDPKTLNPILLAYIGDVVFSLYVRMRLLPTSGQVRVIHDLDAKIVSAKMQSIAMDALEEKLTPEELAVARRGRNTKSQVPKSATVREYRQGTAFEALVGYLFLMEQTKRVEEIMDFSFDLITANMKRGKNK